MPGDEHGLTARDRPIRHVQPLDQLRALGHRHHQFLAVEQCAHPLGQPMLANGVEGFRQFVPSLLNAVATGLGVGSPLDGSTGNGGLERGVQVSVGLIGANQFAAAIHQKSPRVAQKGGDL